jgi:uncharacterized short protein YbdD (DUF466 family)
MKQAGKKAIDVDDIEYDKQIRKIVGKQLIKKNAPLIGGVAAYKSYENHVKTTARRKRYKTYTEKYSGK